VYVDPSEGKAGSVMDTVYGAATSGALKVDPHTGDATLKFLSQVQDVVEAMRRRTDDVGSRTPLGGGFGERVGAFNQELAAGGPDSAQDQLARFSRELEQLKDAVTRSMESYLGTESGNARTITGAGAGR
jgi:hypothetical protein